MRLLTGDPERDYEKSLTRFEERLAKEPAAEFFVSNQVIGEAYIALQHHYGVTIRNDQRLWEISDRYLRVFQPTGLSALPPLVLSAVLGRGCSHQLLEGHAHLLGVVESRQVADILDR